jgi:hypothetical protein
MRESFFIQYIVLYSKHALFRLEIVSVIEKSTKEKYTVKSH